MTLTDFVEARIAEDEAVARAAAARPIVTTYLASNVRREVSPDQINIIWQTDEGRDYPSDRGTFRQGEDHFNRFRPTRVLAECEAKRAIIALHSPTDDAEWYGDDEPPEDGLGCAMCGTRGEYAVAWPCPTLRILAAIYSWHPDFRTEWRP